MSKKQLIVKCPQCAGESIFETSNAWRPFCSERCKKIDFGAWASEEFCVAGRIEELEPDEVDLLTHESITPHRH